MSADPIGDWRRALEAAQVPRSARDFATDLERELREAERGGVALEELARRLQPEPGTDRRSRALRILHRLGWLARALAAAEQSRDRRPGTSS